MRIIFSFVLFVCVYGTVLDAQAMVGSVARKGVEAVIELVARKSGIKLTEQAGKAFSREATLFIAKHGNDGMRVLKGVGPNIMEKVAIHGDDLVKVCAEYSDEGMRFLAKHADDALSVWRRYGQTGTDLLVKHPGLGKKMLDTFGEKGLKLGSRLTSVQVQKLLGITAKVSSRAERSALVEGVYKHGNQFLEFLWKHRIKIAAGASLYSLLNSFEERDITIQPDGAKHIKVTQKGFLGSFLQQMWKSMIKHYPWIPLLLLFVLLYMVWPLIRATRRALAATEKNLSPLK